MMCFLGGAFNARKAMTTGRKMEKSNNDKEREVLTIRLLADHRVTNPMAITQVLFRDFGFIDAKTLSGLIGIPYRSLIEDMVAFDKIPYHRIGRRVRFRLPEIKKWVESGKAESLEVLTKDKEGKWQL